MNQLEDLHVRILYEDGELIVVHKPAGCATESARVTGRDLDSSLRTYLAEKGENPAELRMVHRLDQRVEGILVFAKTGRAASALSAQLTSGEMKKLYLALVSGPVPKESDTLIHWLARDGQTNMSKVVGEPSPGGDGSGKGRKAGGRPKSRRDAPKKAVLHYRRTGERELEIELVTGRHHQIRAQLAAEGMPILGDVKYGGWPDDRGVCPQGAIGLCAHTLSFRHPLSGERMTFRITPAFAGTN